MDDETSLVNAQATVLVYDDSGRSWIPGGPSQTQGPSVVHVYQGTSSKSFRIIGWKIDSKEIVINCTILPNMTYKEATPTFHQWRDTMDARVYGINFQNNESAKVFANVIHRAIENLNGPAVKPLPTPVVYAQPSNVQSQGSAPLISNAPDSRLNKVSYQKTDSRTSNISVTSITMGSDQSSGAVTQHQSSHSLPASSASAPPPPPPPPPPLPTGSHLNAASTEPSLGGGGLAAALQATTLRKTSKAADVTDENDVGAAKSQVTNPAPPKTQPKSGGNMMEEMAKKLQARQKLETDSVQKIPSGPSGASLGGPPVPPSKGPFLAPKTTSNGSHSPQMSHRKVAQSAVDANESTSLPPTAASGSTSATDFESFKQLFLAEMREEIQKAKSEIIEAIKMELKK